MLDAQIASPSSVVASQLDAFMSDDPREAKLCAALRELVARQSFDANGRLKGPGSALHIGGGITTRSGRTAVWGASRRHDSPSSTSSALAVPLAVSRNKTSINL